MNIVLHEPEIPQNAGNIGRSCVAAGARLHMIRPFGFTIDEKRLRRAGMDYWFSLDVTYYDNYEHFMAANKPASLFFATTKASRLYTEAAYPDDAFIMFGKESAGIPEAILAGGAGQPVRIPMRGGVRSLNLSSSVAVILFEAMRQNGFRGMVRGEKF